LRRVPTAARRAFRLDSSVPSAAMAEGDQPLDEVLEEIGVQLAWVRDYL
jgi:hypothetical protein